MVYKSTARRPLIITTPKMRFTLALLLLMVALASATTYSTKYTKSMGVFYPSDPTRTGQMNLLFRSNVPEDDHRNFVYHDLLDETVSKAASERKVIVNPDNVYMFVISLVSNSDGMLPKENQYFKDHPERGEHVNIPILGQNENPQDLDESEIIAKVEDIDWMNDDLEGILSYIQAQVLDFSRDRNVFVIIHCQHGHDRTGEIAGAWGIRYGFLTWNQVNAINLEIGNAYPISYHNQRALTWYCYHLQHFEGYNRLQCSVMNTNSHNRQQPDDMHWDESGKDWALLIPVIVLSIVLFVCLNLVLILLVALLCCWRKRRLASQHFHKLKEELNM